jgi:hypothetical protein
MQLFYSQVALTGSNLSQDRKKEKKGYWGLGMDPVPSLGP